MTYELTNKQREYFGLDPIEKHWDRVIFQGDTYRPDSLLYFDSNTIKRHIISTERKYLEVHYNELTKDRNLLIPKTDKGKEKKLTPSILEKRQPTGIYLSVTDSDLTIGNHTTQTTFYSSNWEKSEQTERNIPEMINEFIEESHETHLSEIKKFKKEQRKNIKFKAGDYFSFKLDRTNFGFGRLLLDVNKIRKKGLISHEHGLNLLMGPPVIVQLFAFKSKTKDIDISILDKQQKLPSDVMMDNLLLYGEFEVIGHRVIQDDEFEFPISYGRSIDGRQVLFLQWGLIHKELPISDFDKYINGDGGLGFNPYGYYSIGIRPSYDTVDIVKAIENKGTFDFSNSKSYKAKRDLRNPINKNVKDELFKAFELDSTKSYVDNCKLTRTVITSELNRKI